MGRRLEIDAVRGLMLVWMVATHLPTFLPTYTNQPFGFVSASEGFIFLSALFTGRIYFRLAERDGYPAVRAKLLLFTPLALTISRRVGWSPILAGSTTLWFLAHLGLREAEHNFVNSVLRVHIPINEMGSFDLWAWQFLWILGLWFG